MKILLKNTQLIFTKARHITNYFNGVYAVSKNPDNITSFIGMNISEVLEQPGNNYYDTLNPLLNDKIYYFYEKNGNSYEKELSNHKRVIITDNNDVMQYVKWFDFISENSFRTSNYIDLTDFDSSYKLYFCILHRTNYTNTIISDINNLDEE